jgi:biotin carboxyl carrier protein
VEAADGAARPLYFAPTEKSGDHAAQSHAAEVPEGTVMVAAPLQGTVVTIQVKEGEIVRPGQQLAVIESMKMEHLVMTEEGGRVTKLVAGDGVTLLHGEPILYLEPLDVAVDSAAMEAEIDLDHIRSDLAEMLARQANTRDENRPASVERRRNTNQRTARENIA